MNPDNFAMLHFASFVKDLMAELGGSTLPLMFLLFGCVIGKEY
jgi:hypothetical protein